MQSESSGAESAEKSLTICVITPRLPPLIDGLGDYCRRLWERWRADQEGGQAISGPGRAVPTPTMPPGSGHRPPWLPVSWLFLVIDGAGESQGLWPEVEIREFARSEKALLDALESSGSNLVILHYVGYGYDTQGSPHWLPAALKRWKRGERKVIVMFHETWARGKPWQKVFWQSGSQKRCAAEVLSVATTAVTSNPANIRDLTQLAPAREVGLIPIGTPFGQPRQILAKNWRRALVFGQEGSRLKALRRHEKLIRSLDSRGFLEDIVLAGRRGAGGEDPAAMTIAGWSLRTPVTTIYDLPRDELPEAVISAGLNLMYTESTYLMKSTGYHLAAQLGQVAVTIFDSDPGGPLRPGTHYLGYKPGHHEELAKQLEQTSLLESIGRASLELSAGPLSWDEIHRLWCQEIESTICS